MFYVLFLANIIFGNDELNRYLDDKNLKYSIVQDTKNQRIIIDLLDNKNRIIIFTKTDNGDYHKIFDEKLYFCNNSSRMFFYSVRIFKNELIIRCTITNVSPSINFNEYYYFKNDLNNKLLKIEKQYINIDDDTIKKDYMFIPQTNIPTLKNYTNKFFLEEYLLKNEKYFKEEKIVKTPTEILESLKSEQSTLITFYELSTIIANNEINTQTINQYNDIAYYLQQANANDEAIFLLEKILVKFPKRTVAYLNLADAYNEKYLVQNLNNNAKYFKEKAKTNYEKYIELMKQDGKENKIPKRVLEYK